MIVTQNKLFDVGRVVVMGQEFLLTDINQLVDKLLAGLESHDTVTEAPHGLIAEDVSECVFLSSLASFARRRAEHVLFLRVDGVADHIRTELRNVLELVNLGQ